ncbi:hypothetical protein BDR03DRAFT_953574 [Suillus americanus]|nr:hypothetical protein BDR03DRAFT_953574 [Suillus americanus]
MLLLVNYQAEPAIQTIALMDSQPHCTYLTFLDALLYHIFFSLLISIGAAAQCALSHLFVT